MSIESTTSIKTLGEEALFGTNIKNFTASQTLTRIGADAFFMSKVEIIDLYNADIKYIGPSVFAGTKYIKTIILPNKLKTLDLSAFSKEFTINKLKITSSFDIMNKHSNPKLYADIMKLMTTK